MNRRLVGLLVAAGLALVGTLLLIAYVNSAEDRAAEGERRVSVFVVSEPIGRGTKADDIGGRITTEQVPAKVRADAAVRNLSEITGRVAAVDLLPGEQLVATRWVTPETIGRAGVPEGLLEVTVALEPERALGGRLKPGDTVAVLASFEGDGGAAPGGAPRAPTQSAAGEVTHLILHKVIVTNVQVERQAAAITSEEREEGKAEQAPTGKLLVTLALNAPSIERVVFAAEHGTVWLAAEPPLAPEAGTKVVTRDNEYQ